MTKTCKLQGPIQIITEEQQETTIEIELIHDL